MRFFIGLFAVVLAIASVVGFSGCQQQASIEGKSGQYQVSVHIPDSPLKTRKETYTITVKDIHTSQPMDTESLSVKVTMTMPDHTMEAPTTVEKLDQSGTYKVTTEFMMAGDWTMEVKPAPSAETVSLKLPVKDNE